MPPLTREILEQGMNVDYEMVRDFTRKVFEILNGSKLIEVRTDLGTDLKVKVGKYLWCAGDGDIQPGSFDNLPAGEVFTSPEDVEGVAVIDGVLGDYFDAKYGSIKHNPVSIEIRNGKAVEGTLRCDDRKLREELRNYIFRKDLENATRVGEFALGTNLGLERIIGQLLQDEKFPSVHIAFGDCYPNYTGCPFSCGQHLDGVILGTTVDVDGFRLMDAGEYTI
jgi:leucyl aminopeptidase (aminopeptidase T)